MRAEYTAKGYNPFGWCAFELLKFLVIMEPFTVHDRAVRDSLHLVSDARVSIVVEAYAP